MNRPGILFVDDEPLVLTSIERALIHEPFALHFAASGPEALALLEQVDVQVVVADLRMPGMDGLALLRRIRESHPDIVRMVFSGLCEGNTVVRAINEGEVYRFVAKPLDEHGEWLAALRQALAHHGLMRKQRELTRELEVCNAELRDQRQRMEEEILLARRMRRELETSGQRYEQLARQSRTVVWEMDAEGLYTYVGPAIESVLGYRAAELVGRLHFYDLHPEKGREALKTLAFGMIAKRESFVHHQNEMLAKDGHTVWMSSNGFPLFDENGKLVGYRGSDTDITERKRTEDRLAFQAQVLDSASESVVVTDLQGKILYWGRGSEKMYGYAADEVLDRPYVDVAGSVESTDDGAFRKEILANGVWHGEHRQRRRNGELFWTSVHISLLKDGDGHTVGFIGIDHDITASKSAEEEREIQTRMQEMLMKISSTFIRVDLEKVDRTIETSLGELGGFVGADRVYLFDYDFAEEICRNTHEWCAEGILPQINDLQVVPLSMIPQWTAVHRRGETMLIPDVMALPPDDGVRQVLEPQGVQSLIAVPMMDGDRCLGFAGFDSVSRKRLYSEGERRLLTVFVQMLVNVRQRRNLEQELRSSRELAEAANKAKSEFLANLSHEIRTPMNGVIGMTELLLNTELSADQRRFAETAMSSAESLLSLLNDILDFSKMEAGKLHLEMLDLDLHKVMEWAVAPLALRAQQKGVEFICAALPGIPARLRGDPVRLRQVLVNLAGNAVKFTARGEIALLAELVEEEADRVKLRFTVRDTGVGIPQDKTAKLFKKFSQVDSSTTRLYGGTGLGLAIAKQLAEMMGGEIGVESNEGEGTTFWFTAWFEKHGAGHSEEKPEGAELRGTVRGSHVLVVDDNESNREVLKAQLNSWGMRPEFAVDGPDALRVLGAAEERNDPFQMAILDMQMPGMDGLALGKAMKADAAFRAVPLVMLTSIGFQEGTRPLREAGFAAWLPKPVRQSELLDTMALVLAGKPVPGRAPTSSAVSPLPASGRRILLVEDNEINRMVAVGVLKKMRLDVHSVQNGAEALEALARDRYDLILMDCQMPVMDGYEATRRIRQKDGGAGGMPAKPFPASASIPIIAMTAHAMLGDREKCIQAGMDDYLPKPVSQPELVAILDKWLPKMLDAPPPIEVSRPPEANADPEPAVFDSATLMNRAMGDPELAQAMMDAFAAGMPKQIELLRKALDAEDWPSVIRAAHTIKGASANLSGEALRAAALEMEMAAKAGDRVAGRNRMADIDRQLALLLAEMKQGNS